MAKLLTAAVAASLIALPAAGAIAQTTTSADDQNTITIFAPRVETKTSPDMIGKTRTITASSVVQTSDLNLRTEAGREELKERVNDAAKETCDWLDQVYPLDAAMTDDMTCVNNAVNGAKEQMDRVLANYSG